MKIIKKIIKKISKIRRIIDNNKDFIIKKKDNYFVVICSCMDTIEDTAEAMKYYENWSGIDKLRQRGMGKTYLLLFGFLQAINVQQDALMALYKLINNKEFNQPNSFKKIRNIRINKFAHLVNRDGKSNWSGRVNFVTRPGLSQWYIEGHYYKNNGKDEWEKIDLKEKYNNYIIEAFKIIEKLYKDLKDSKTEVKNIYK